MDPGAVCSLCGSLFGIFVSITLASVEISLGDAALGKCAAEPWIPTWLMGEWCLYGVNYLA